MTSSSIEKNYDKEFDWIYRSATQGNMEAQFLLADLYALNHGTFESSSQAYKWYTKSAIQGYKKALIRISNLYQEDIKMHCRGQLNSEEEEWTNSDFKKKNNIMESNEYRLEQKSSILNGAINYAKKKVKVRELNEYRLEQRKSILNGAISFYTQQFKDYQSANQEDSHVQLNLAFLYQHGYGVKKCTRWAFEYYEMAAKQGDADAQYNLGDLYRKHTKMKFNYRLAFKWLTKSAQGGNRAAQRCLAYFYLKGLATNMNYDAAFSWYTKAAEAGDAEAMVTLGKLYRKSEYVKQDLQKAVHWYTLAARQGNIVAQNCLSQLHQRGMLNGIHLEEDMLDYLTESSMNNRLCTKLSTDISKLGDSPNVKRLNDLAKHALIGDGQAMYEIGLKYLKGDSQFIQDEDAGVKWIKNAANTKHKDAQLKMADMYKKGGSVEQNYHKAAIWYKTLAKQKDAAAQYHVGVMYNEGLGVRKDPLEASKWFIWAADQGNSDAKFDLSMLRFQGVGLHQDKEEALELLIDSASHKNVKSCHYLGEMYLTGHSVPMSMKLGFPRLKFAAKNGYIPAQMKLAFEYNRDVTVNRDMQACVQYYTMASDAGNLDAKYILGRIYLGGYGICQDYVKAYHLFMQAKKGGHAVAKELFQDLSMRNGYNWRIMNYSGVIQMFVKVTEQGIDNLYYNIGSICELALDQEIDGRPCKISTLDEYRRKPRKKYHTKAIGWYIVASEKGDTRADYRLGLLYEHGYYVEKNLNVAISYYERASRNENADAHYRLACLYLEGRKVRQDMSEAFHHYRKASTLGHQKASEALFISKDNNHISVFLDSLGGSSSEFMIFINSKTKIKMLETATEKGWSQLQYQIGVWYEEEQNDYESAFEWFYRAANIGVTVAYYRMGLLYDKGAGVIQDYTMAAEAYQKATEKEHENACHRLGQLYQYGAGVKRDFLKAYTFYKKAKNMGHMEAHKVLNITLVPKIDSNGDVEENYFDPSSQIYQFSLLMCEYVAQHGDTDIQFKVGFAHEYCTPETNYLEAYKWYSLAAKELHKEACYHLGLLYEKGLGISKNYEKAIQLYEQASQVGSDNAVYRLGQVYHHEIGVKIDSSKAAEYYIVSAELGNPQYQCELGKLYEEGTLVEKNPLEALKWYTKGYLQGDDSIGPKLHAMYLDKPYEDFLFKRLFRNLSIASCGHFRLTSSYHEHDYRDLNNKLGIFCALGYGTDKDARRAWGYFTKKYDGYDSKFEVDEIMDFRYNLSPMEKGNILKTLGEDENWMKQAGEQDLLSLESYFFGGLVVKEREMIGFQGDYRKAESYDDIGEYYPALYRRYFLLEKDYSKAFKCLKFAANKGSQKSFALLGMMYHCGSRIDQAKEQCKARFDNTAQSDIKCLEHIATSHHTYEGKQNFKKAFEWYSRAFYDLHNVSSQYERERINEIIQAGLALLYEFGDGVEKDYQKALEYYTSLSDNSSSIGSHLLALMYYYGKGVERNHQKSLRLFEKVDTARIWNARLPFVYDRNQHNGKDSQRNRLYCTIDTNKVRGESYYWIGLLYKNGQGVSQDQEKSQNYFEKALKFHCKRAKLEIDYY